MKKNISINLYGTLYAIDEDAYNLLENYINSMKNYFSRQDGGEEISDDIEHRIAELLWAKKEEGAEAVNIEMVKEIISTIGNPAEIDQDVANDGANATRENAGNDGAAGNTTSSFTSESSSYSNNYSNQYNTGTKSRRLYRDMSDKILGGVCSGLCKYMGCSDPIWFRLGTVALVFLLPNIFTLFGGLGQLFHLVRWFTFNISFSFIVPLAYVLLWFIVPEARTPEDKLRMEGKDVNPDNIREEVLKETTFNTDGRQYSAYSTPSGHKSSSTDGCLKGCAGGCLIVIAAPFLIAVIGILFAIISVVIGLAVGVTSFPFLDFGGEGHMLVMSQTYHNNLWIAWAGVLCGVFVLITPIALLIRRLSSKGSHMSSSSVVIVILLWVMALVGAISSFVVCTNRLIINIKQYEEEQVEASLIDLNGVKFSEDDYNFFINNGWEMKEAENCEKTWRGVPRYTYSGHYPTGDRSVVYLDSDRDYSTKKPMRYTAETHEHVEPGVYRLSALCKANQKGAYIYVYNALEGDSVKVYAEIPCYGGEGGNLIMAAKDSLFNEDKVVKELVYRLKNNPYPKEDDDDPDNEFEAVKNGNEGKGFGWSYVYIDNIKVDNACDIYYGVTTVKNGKCNYQSWFSATDFVLEKVK